MRTLLLFLHFVGMALWIGGALAAMVTRVSARREGPTVRASVARLLARVQIVIVAPGALLTAASGFGLAFYYMAHGNSEILGVAAISGMMGAGTVAALLVLFVGMPTAAKIAALAQPSPEGRFPPAFERLQRRQAIVQSVAGVLALAALWLGAVWR